MGVSFTSPMQSYYTGQADEILAYSTIEGDKDPAILQGDVQRLPEIPSSVWVPVCVVVATGRRHQDSGCKGEDQEEVRNVPDSIRKVPEPAQPLGVPQERRNHGLLEGSRAGAQ